MWALRRAANPLRTQSNRIVVARACCAESHILSGKMEDGGCHENDCHVVVEQILPKPSFCGHSVSSRSFCWTRNLSSQAGEKSSDVDDEVEEGFSELEAPLESDKDEDKSDKEEEDVALEGAISEEELDGRTENALGLSDAEGDSGVEKKSVRKSTGYPLFGILMNSARQAINGALSKWVDEGNPLGRPEISMTLLSLRRRRFYGKALQFFEWLEANKRIDFEERDYSSYLDLVAKVHGIYKAEKFLDKIPQSFKGELAYRTLLANCVATGNIKKSEEIFNKMRDLGFPISTFVCNQLLLLYKRNDRKKLPDVLKLMEKEDVKPSLFTFKLLIDTKGRANDIEGMDNVVDLMKEQGMEPDLGIRAMIAKYYIYGNLKEKAEAVLKEIEGEDINDNRLVAKELLPLYAALNKADDVERIWKVCEKNPRLEECAAAIEAWGKLGKIEDAEKVFELMTKTWKRLSAKYYNTLLKVYANHKLLSKGKDLAKRMSEDGCNIGPLTLDALINLYVEAGEVSKADSILQKAVSKNQVRPLFNSYMTVMEKYAKRGDVHNAEKIFHKLRQSGYTGRMSLYQLLLQAYANAKTPAYGFRERMKADNMFPNRVVANQLAAVDAFKKTEMSELLDD